jgi:hypothetical protein
MSQRPVYPQQPGQAPSGGYPPMERAITHLALPGPRQIRSRNPEEPVLPEATNAWAFQGALWPAVTWASVIPSA